MNARHPDLSDLQLAISARFANKYKLDTDDVRQELEIIKIECAGSFDAGRGTARESYYLKELENRCKRMRSQTRYGVELDSEEVSDAAQAEAEAAIANAKAGGVAGWRVRSDEEAAERVDVLPEHLRAFGQRFAAGMSCKEAAEELGLTDRRARQVVEEIVEFFADNSSSQPSLF